MITEQESLNLIWFHKTHKHLRSIGDGSDYRGIEKEFIHTEWIRQLFYKVDFQVTGILKEETGKTYYPEQTGTLNEWEIGGFQEPHLDTYSNVELNSLSSTEIDHLKTHPNREWTLILPLNANFKGGECYFPAADNNPVSLWHSPAAGEGVLFNGIDHLHGVTTVRRGSRHTVSNWYSSNPDNIPSDQRKFIQPDN
tara:strand:+ start:85 stop:672 length:588 start_codon:yes stop_codon:yes gene_type:complete